MEKQKLGYCAFHKRICSAARNSASFRVAVGYQPVIVVALATTGRRSITVKVDSRRIATTMLINSKSSLRRIADTNCSESTVNATAVIENIDLYRVCSRSRELYVERTTSICP